MQDFQETYKDWFYLKKSTDFDFKYAKRVLNILSIKPSLNQYKMCGNWVFPKSFIIQ